MEAFDLKNLLRTLDYEIFPFRHLELWLFVLVFCKMSDGAHFVMARLDLSIKYLFSGADFSNFFPGAIWGIYSQYCMDFL